MRYLHITALVAIIVGSSTTASLAQSSNLAGYWDLRFGPKEAGGMGVTGQVRTVAVHPITGDVYVGGDLSFAGGDAVRRIARWDGTQWNSLGAGTGGRVHALAIAPDGTLYVGGEFQWVLQTDGTIVEATNIARWDGEVWSRVGLGVTATVYALEFDQGSGNLYVGGRFLEAVNTDSTEAGSARIARWDGASWEPVGQGLASGNVEAIAVDPTSGNVAVAGLGLDIVINSNGTEVDTDGLAFWDGSAWSKPDEAPIRINVLEYDAQGQLIVGGGFFGIGGLSIAGIARFDGDEWHSLGGSVPNGGVAALALTPNGLFVAGSFTQVRQDDEAIIEARRVAYLDVNEKRWYAMGDGIRAQHSAGLNAIAVTDSRVFTGGVTQSAGGAPTDNFAVWHRVARTSVTRVRFSVDTRSAAKYGLVGNGWAPRPLLQVLTGALAGLYYTFDDDGDGIHSIEIDQPAGQVIEYVFLIDNTGDNIDDHSDAVFELNPPSVTRKIFVPTNGQPISAPVALFDGRNLPGPDPNALEYDEDLLAEGARDSGRLMTASHVHGLFLLLEESDRTVFVGVWQTDEDPAGPRPPEILQIANELLWTFETYPAAADYKMKVEWDYSEVTGIADPNSLTMLHRKHPDSVWTIVPTEVVLNDEELHTPGVEALAGQWTIGSFTADNVLTNRLPGIAKNPRPEDGVLAAPIRPNLRWSTVHEASSYDVYVWPANESQPGGPTDHAQSASTIVGPLTDGIEYNWRIVARNINGSTEGPVWSFTVGDTPDLVVNSVGAPTEAFSGQEVAISWTTSNTGVGSTNVPGWFDTAYLSSSTEFDPKTDFRLGSTQNVSVLGPQQGYGNQTTFTLPRGIQGPFYVLMIADRSPKNVGLLDEADESNNVTASDPINITLEPFADLRVTDVIAPDLVFSGDSIGVTWTVYNDGTGQTDTDRWFDTIFISDDSVFNFNFVPGTQINIRETSLASFEHVGALEVGESYTITHRLKIPDDTIGDYQMFVYADNRGGSKQPERGHVYEFNQELNNWTPEALSVTLTPPPDLQVTSVVGPSEALSGQLVPVQWTVTNGGAGATRSGMWYDDVFLSTSATDDSTGSLLIGHFRHLGDLQVDESYQAADQVTVPDGWIGETYFHVRTDVNEDEFEFTYEDNNSGATGAAAQIALAPYPDLWIDNVTVLPATATAGAQAVLRYEIVNDGHGPASGTWIDSVFASSESTFERSQSLVVGGVVQKLELDAGERKAVTAALTIPAAATGQIVFFVVPDAGEHQYEYPDNPIGVGRTETIQVTAYPPVDLAAELNGGPAEAGSGSSIMLTLTVRNEGTGRTLVDRWFDRIYLSDDDVLDAETDKLLYEANHQGFLKGGGSYSFQRSLTLPDGVSGAQFLILHSDAKDVVAEVDNDNNVVATSIEMMLTPPSDLRVSQVSAPVQIDAGTDTEITWSVENVGTGGTGGDHWFDALYLSTDKRRGGFDMLLGTFEHNGSLDAGGSYEGSAQVVFPSWAAGPYYLLAIPDTRNDIYEHLAEGNNLGTHIVELRLPLPSDLAVSDITAPSQAQPGDSLEVSWTVTNVGPNPAKGRIRDAVFISGDQSWDITDPLLAVAERVIDLAPGAAGKRSMTVDVGRIFEADSLGTIRNKLPGLLPGDYYLIVRSDIANVVRETDLTNNLAVGSNVLDVAIPRLELGVPEAMTIGVGQSRYFAADVGADVDLRLTLSSDRPGSGNEIYVAFERPPVAGGDFDWFAAEPFLANQELVFPVDEPGTYYVLVWSRSLPNGVETEELTLLGEALTFAVGAIEPAVAGDRGETSFIVSGARFRVDSDVFIHRDGADTVRANLIDFRNSTELLARVPTAGLELRAWDLSVENPGGQIATMEGGLTIEEADPRGLKVEVVAPEAGRVGVPTPMQILATNTTNVNVEAATVLVRYPQHIELLDFQVPASRMSQGLSPEEDIIKWDDGSAWFMYFLSDLRPGETDVLDLVVRASAPIDAGLAVRATEYTSAGLFWRLLKGEYASILSGALDFPDTSDEGDSSTGKRFETSQNDCDPCKDLGEGEREVCEYRARAKPTVDYGKKLGFRFFGGGPRSVGSTGGWKDMWCAPVGESACGDQDLGPPPKQPCFCAGGSCSYPHDPTWWNPFDPNEMVGPESFGEDNWVRSDRALNYMIRFENDPELATAPAQLVQIRQQLDTDLDERTFRLGPFGFGDMTFSPPENVAHFDTRIDLADSLGFLLDVTAGLNVITNEVFWSLKTIDPTTGDQPTTDPRAGFLPVNDSTDAGQGWVSYRIAADDNSATGDTVHAVARIVFDTNAPIDTPTIFNTLDAAPPVSSVNVLPVHQDSSVFNISWTGSDVGSGIRDYSLHRSVDGAPFEVIEANVIDTTRLFVGQIGHKYHFFTIATDNAGNVEPFKTDPEAFTVVSTEEDNPAGIPKEFALHQNYPNPFNPSTTIPFDLPENGHVEIGVYDVIGRLVLTVDKGDLSPGRYQHLLRMDQYASGVYFYQLRVTGKSAIKFADVGKFVLIK